MGGRDCDKSNDITIQIIININQKKSLQLERTSRPTRSTEQMRIKSMIETHATSTCSWKALEHTLDYHLHARINSIPLFHFFFYFFFFEIFKRRGEAMRHSSMCLRRAKSRFLFAVAYTKVHKRFIICVLLVSEGNGCPASVYEDKRARNIGSNE